MIVDKAFVLTCILGFALGALCGTFIKPLWLSITVVLPVCLLMGCLLPPYLRRKGFK